MLLLVSVGGRNLATEITTTGFCELVPLLRLLQNTLLLLSSLSSSYHTHNHNGFSTSFRLFSLENRTSFRCSHRSLQWPALLLRQDPGKKKKNQFPIDIEKRKLRTLFQQTLKERFAEQLPEKIEQIKKLRK